MIDLIVTDPTEGPATLFTRNFRAHAGLAIGLYSEGPRSPVALVYGDISAEVLDELACHYRGIVAIPSMKHDEIPDEPSHYETMTLKAPILATIQRVEREGFGCLEQTWEGDPFVLKGFIGNTLAIIFTADLVKATIRILSGELEQNTGRDRYGRHNPLPENVTGTPAVSLHFNLIENALRYVFKRTGQVLLGVSRWPGSAPLALFLSHDVDVVKKWTFKRSVYEIARALPGLFRFRGGELSRILTSIAEALRGRDPYWMFDELMFMENGNGFSSTWFFAPFGGKYNERLNEFDPVYHRTPSEITAMIRRLLENGCELGLHGTRQSFQETTALREQLASFERRLGFRLMGARQHYLMFRHGQTLEAAAGAGLLYDATLGFSDRVGFRNGMASPFFPHPSGHPAGPVIELPLHFMDTVFTHSAEDPELLHRRITECYLYAKAARGMFSLLVHPGNMDEMEMPGFNRFYQSLLARFRMDGAKSMTALDLAHWWEIRERLLKNLESAENAWRIRDIAIPQDMEITLTAANIKSMRFAITGASGTSQVSNDTLTIKPAPTSKETGITITRRQ